MNQVKCANPRCGNLFTPRSIAHGFCCAACRKAARSGWKWLRSAALERDNEECQDCHVTGCTLDVHHIEPLAKGGENRLNNLVSLCKGCHKKRHKSWAVYQNRRIANDRRYDKAA